MAFNQDVNDFYKNLLDFIKKYENLKTEPFSQTLLMLLEKHVETFKNNSSKIIKRLSKFEYNSINKFNDLSLLYDKNCENIRNEFNEEIKELTSIAQAKINELNDLNKNIKNDLKNKTIEHELEVSYFKSGNDQNIAIFESECENAISRFDYQLENSKVAYNESVKYFNDDLKEKLKNENQKYENDLIEYDYGTESIADRYNDKIDDANQELNVYVSRFNSIQERQKENKYVEAVDLNNRIRNLVTETNQNIVAEKIDYSKDQNVNKIEHDMKRRELLVSAQRTSKDFVVNMDKLNNKMNYIKDTYNEKKNEVERELQYTLLSNHKKQEDEIKSLIYNNSNEAEKKITRINKLYSSINKYESNKTNTELKKLERDFLQKNSENTYNKNILDLNRSYDLRINNEKENADNKYFQALDNIDENDFSYKTKIHQNNYNINANIIKLENSIKMLKLDSTYEKENILHELEIQRLSNNLKICRLELTSLIDIQDKVHECEKKKHEKCIKYLTIYNLLEIEKCRTLAEFNKRNYDRNVDNAKQTLRTSKKTIEIQNNKVESINNLNIEYETIQAEKQIVENDNNISLITAKRDGEIALKERKLIYDTEILSNNLLYDRFKIELKRINNTITSFISLLNELEHTSKEIVCTSFNNITFRPEYVNTLREFNVELFKMVYEYYKNIVDSLVSYEERIIEDRISFEKDFKFKSNYEEIMIEYNSQFEELYTKKEEIENSIDSLNVEIDLKNQSIFAIKNQIAIVRNPYNQHDKSAPSIKKSYSTLKQQLKNTEFELFKILEKQNNLKKDLADLLIEIDDLRIENEKKEYEISVLQYNGSISYFNMRKDLHNYFNTLHNSFKNKLFDLDGDITVTNYIPLISKKCDELLKFNSDVKQYIYEVTNKFSASTAINFNKTDKITIAKYSKDMEKLNEKMTDNINEINDKIVIDNRNHNEKLIEIEKRKINTEKNYNSLVKKLASEQAANSKNSIILKEKIEQQFYSEFYALRDNQAAIVKDYETSIKELEDETDTYKKSVITRLSDTQIKLDTELKTVEKQKNIYIKELPERVHIQEATLTREAREKNKNLQKQKIEDKTTYYSLRSEYFKNLTELQYNYRIKLKSINSERKSKLRGLKRKHSSELRHI